MRMKHLLRNKRGATLELAIITMLIVFGLCLVLLTVAELSAVRAKRTYINTSERIALDSIGDDFYRACKLNNAFDVSPYQGEYTPLVENDEGNIRRLLVYRLNKLSTPLLCVEVRGMGDGCKIVRWSYAYVADRTQQEEEEA